MAAPVSIDFDDAAAPCNFASQVPLASQYASQGVSFAAGNGNPFEVLNQCGNFGFSAHSGSNFLAYNSSITGSTFKAIFTEAMGSASIWPASANGGQLLIEAYDANNVLVDSASASASRAWQQLSVSGVGITSLRLVGLSTGGFDDFQFEVAVSNDVPEPGALALAALGLLGVALSRRRRSV